jgi:hypothetical protein
VRTLLLMLVGWFMAAVAVGQCQSQWTNRSPLAGLDGWGRSQTLWDPDGAGPQGPWLVFGGDFRVAGDQIANGIAALDLATNRWQAFGSGLPGHDPITNRVACVHARGNGELVMGSSANGVWRWQGNGWQAIGPPAAAGIVALGSSPTGDLIVLGQRNQAGSSLPLLERWDGVSWTAIPLTISGPPGSGWLLFAMALLPNGDLVIGGSFQTVNGVAADNIARWDGSQWHALGSGTDGAVTALTVRQSGALVVGGGFLLAGGQPRPGIAEWQNGSWSGFGTGLGVSFPIAVHAVTERANGELIAGGNFAAAGAVPCSGIARWDGVAWHALGAGLQSDGFITGPRSLQILPDGTLSTIGGFTRSKELACLHAARWDGSSWAPLQRGNSGWVLAILPLEHGDLAVGGSFRQFAGIDAQFVAVRQQGTWTNLGQGLNSTVNCLLRLTNGDLIAGGSFTLADNLPANRIARWNGTSWQALAAGFNGPVNALLQRPDGTLIATGAFSNSGGTPVAGIASWNGQAWQPLGSGINGQGIALVTLPNGDQAVSGYFTNPANRLARWDGSSWSGIGSFAGAVGPMAMLTDGSLVVGRERYDGSSWSTLGGSQGGSTYALLAAPDDSLIAAGVFSSGGQLQRLQRWDGNSWTPLDTQLDNSVVELALTEDGELLLGGSFRQTEAGFAAFFASRESGCRATVTNYGTGCSGSAGTLQLEAESRPWLSTTARARLRGAAPNSLAVIAVGLQPTALPLASLHPLGVAGCTLWLLPLVSQLAVVGGSELTTGLTLPPLPSLIGLAIGQQVVVLESVLGSNAALLASDALAWQVGLLF